MFYLDYLFMTSKMVVKFFLKRLPGRFFHSYVKNDGHSRLLDMAKGGTIFIVRIMVIKFCR